MHLGLQGSVSPPIQLSVTETQSSPPSSGSSANPFPPDLWGYVHGLAIDLIYELAVYGKSLFAGPSEVSSMDLAIS